MGPCEQPVTRSPGLCAPEDIPAAILDTWTDIDEDLSVIITEVIQ